jgi:hypothetical protein
MKDMRSFDFDRFGILIIIRGFLLVLLFMHGFILFAEDISVNHYLGCYVVKQEIENHQAMLKTLQNLMLQLPADNKTCKLSIEELTNYTKAALISFKYLDSLWANNEKSPYFSANLPCACNGSGTCGACGGDGYVWIADEESKKRNAKNAEEAVESANLIVTAAEVPGGLMLIQLPHKGTDNLHQHSEERIYFLFYSAKTLRHPFFIKKPLKSSSCTYTVSNILRNLFGSPA